MYTFIKNLHVYQKHCTRLSLKIFTFIKKITRVLKNIHVYQTKYTYQLKSTRLLKNYTRLLKKFFTLLKKIYTFIEKFYMFIKKSTRL